ncbi:ABC transporter ATP-binding protein [Salinibaculum salinum]|uniref:ABC transporter ATP-binding protein n=1 Tax=Salinibaculum salinum TaxID=3131996 RepID=UPI0030EE183E
MPAIQTDNLTKRFGSGEAAIVALDGLDLTVDRGEVFGFLGPNGAGKSTTINILLNFLDPTEGSAEVLGYDVQSESMDVRKRTGVLPEGCEVFERLTAREHIEWMKETKDADEDTMEILETVGIPEAADRKAGDFSKGMQQRLALGMALVGDPELLILDEPSSGLDPTGMQEMREIIQEQAEQGTTVFFSSHILSEVEAVCDRVAILSEGKLMVEDSLATLRDEGGIATIDLEVNAVPDDLGLDAIAEVQDVTVDGNIVSVTCTDPAAKVDVIEHVNRQTDVLDILSEDTSLEEVFRRYTGSDATTRRDGEASDEAPEVTA